MNSVTTLMTSHNTEGPYINTSPQTVHESASVQKTYQMFRSMALRHLCVVDDENVCVGVITRHDLLEHTIEDRLEAANVRRAF